MDSFFNWKWKSWVNIMAADALAMEEARVSSFNVPSDDQGSQSYNLSISVKDHSCLHTRRVNAWDSEHSAEWWLLDWPTTRATNRVIQGVTFATHELIHPRPPLPMIICAKHQHGPPAISLDSVRWVIKLSCSTLGIYMLDFTWLTDRILPD